MNRRSFGKMLTLFGLAPLWKGEKEVARIGDIFASWAAGDRLNHAEIEQMRRTMNEVQAQSRQVGNILDNTGGLDPNIFSHKASGFGILPHESGGMYSHTDVVQSVPKDTPTTVEFQDTNDGPHVQWQGGVKLDFANNSIKLTNSLAGSLWLLTGGLAWGEAITSAWFVGFIDSVSGRSVTALSETNNETVGYPVVVIQTESAGANWTMSIAHTEGANIDLSTAWFSATRLR